MRTSATLERSAGFGGPRQPRVALVAMPWASAWMPSIQLMVLRQCLGGSAAADTYELYLDYASRISAELYRHLCEAGGVTEEWLFSKCYFEAEGFKMKEGFLDDFPALGIGTRAEEKRIVSALAEVSHDFVHEQAETIDWGQYDVIAFTLGIYQTAASLAMAREIRRRHPSVRVIMGGNSCVGEGAAAILNICPYVDAVATGEAEPTFLSAVEALASGGAVQNSPGVAYRSENGSVEYTAKSDLVPSTRREHRPNYDAYYDRFKALGFIRPDIVWLPFESSRGCWWGEKSQCTFCGLHEVMKYRARPAEDVLEDLDYMHDRYGATRFFATDLIMPQQYYKTLLPRLIQSDRQYNFFYEMKANVTREQLGLMVAAGVHEVQPGLESLSTNVLKLMKKGQTGTHVVQFLKWASEYRLKIQWNVITGMPGEDASEYERLAEKLAALHHLPPPRLVQFELDKYSPIYDDPAKHGLSNIGPLYIYPYVYPVGGEDLQGLAYRFEYHDKEFGGPPPWLGGDGDDAEYPQVLASALKVWESAYAEGASLTLDDSGEDGCLKISRQGGGVRVERTLSGWQSALYRYLDERRSYRNLGRTFAKHDPTSFKEAGDESVLHKVTQDWVDDGIAYEESGFVVGLAVTSVPRPVHVPAIDGNDGDGGMVYTDVQKVESMLPSETSTSAY